MYGKNAWAKYPNTDEVMKFNGDYKDFITNCKTERLCVNEAVRLAKEKGYKCICEIKTLKEGDKVYATNKGKNFAAFVIGKNKIEDGLRVLGAHIDSPRMDLKQNPLYEDKNFALLDTHYYGGIKKYQWVTIPLALVGVVCKKDGSIIDVNIGNKKEDPIFGITDLLIHLSADQLQKPAAKVIEGESLDLSFGSIPLSSDEKGTVKDNVLKILKDQYNIEEEDFVSAEIEVVPADDARDYGIDRGMVAGYGHDDRVCAYTSLRAVLDQGACEYTTCAILVDKEEVGSIGATGAASKWFENIIAELINKQQPYNDLALRHAMANTLMLSSDVSAGFDPLYAGVNEPRNSAYLGKGICINKYTGARGKSGCNDAMPEFIAKIRNHFDNNNVYYQTAELGRVDQGGGGTIAYILGNYNMNVIDAGVPVLNMHSPMEVVSKVDVYEAYVAYKAFLTIK